MPRDEEHAEEDLATAIERVRADHEFTERLARLIERDREILDRLAGDDPHERIDDAADREAAE
jgi:FixJ family two-component response regulator